VQFVSDDDFSFTVTEEEKTGNSGLILEELISRYFHVYGYAYRFENVLDGWIIHVNLVDPSDRVWEHVSTYAEMVGVDIVSLVAKGSSDDMFDLIVRSQERSSVQRFLILIDVYSEPYDIRTISEEPYTDGEFYYADVGLIRNLNIY
jgi:hypothetical protein